MVDEDANACADRVLADWRVRLCFVRDRARMAVLVTFIFDQCEKGIVDRNIDDPIDQPSYQAFKIMLADSIEIAPNREELVGFIPVFLIYFVISIVIQIVLKYWLTRKGYVVTA